MCYPEWCRHLRICCVNMIWMFTREQPIWKVRKAASSGEFYVLHEVKETAWDKTASPDESERQRVLATGDEPACFYFQMRAVCFPFIYSWCTGFCPLLLFGLQLGLAHQTNRSGVHSEANWDLIFLGSAVLACVVHTCWNEPDYRGKKTWFSLPSLQYNDLF